ncbi:orotidine-5'-phosphate decarboxylase [Leucobacter sp. cx-328]|uniref:orotidine-5'-phosphate decarboxylase n=1 Tax=Leucobacter sp. cx-328 TaxID=2770550 RepID=UPI00165D5462|nr:MULTISPECIES: orotidine-5'-phosphate decarboxylase [unclassified Leucobacter]MBC9944927.1 orotidine-5'-phosphate decarboxylase [Leucobacter sp. cx-328]
MSQVTFGDRLAAEFAAGRHLCAGIDPHAGLLADWGLANDAAGAERMGRDVVAAAAGVAACVKPQIAFFERFGSAGFVALERVYADAREAGVLIVTDAKRGDIGSTFAAYADTWLAEGSPLESDALTVSPYLGFGALSGAFDYVNSHGKGLFVLAATSNPEARELQTAKQADGRTLANVMIDEAIAHGAPADTAVNSVGVVLGATLTLADFGIDVQAERGGAALPVLAPGFGHQGGRIEDAGEIFGNLGKALLANESRSILVGGSATLATRVRDRADAIAHALA